MAKEKIFPVTPISPGIAIGKVIRISGSHVVKKVEPQFVSEDAVQSELNKFHSVLEITKQSVRELKEKLSGRLSSGEAAIFDSHLMILEDMALVNDIEKARKKYNDRILSRNYTKRFWNSNKEKSNFVFWTI